MPQLVELPCWHCGSNDNSPWAVERGYTVVRCAACDLLFVNPAPPAERVTDAVVTGFHENVDNMDVRAARIAKKVGIYETRFRRLLADVWDKQQPIHWLDVGSGYGELLEAVTALAPAGSTVEGVEPMRPKAEAARARGLTVTNDFLRPDHAKVDIVSSIDVYSHIPDYRAFLRDVVAVLKPGGEMVLETGNLADLRDRASFPHELGLPDHLVFAGRKHIEALLEEAGFAIVAVDEVRIDGWVNLAKNAVKKLLGRPASSGLPGQSAFRQLTFRAKLRG